MSAIPQVPPGVSLAVDEETQARVEANLRLTQRFFDMLFDDPSIVDAIPAEANVVFIPHDDPALAARHRAAGERMREAGRIVHFFEV